MSIVRFVKFAIPLTVVVCTVPPKLAPDVPLPEVIAKFTTTESSSIKLPLVSTTPTVTGPVKVSVSLDAAG